MVYLGAGWQFPKRVKSPKSKKQPTTARHTDTSTKNWGFRWAVFILTEWATVPISHGSFDPFHDCAYVNNIFTQDFAHSGASFLLPIRGSVLACVSGNPFNPQHLPGTSVNVLRSHILLEPRTQKDLWGLFLELVPFILFSPSLSPPSSLSHPPFQISCNPG